MRFSIAAVLLLVACLTGCRQTSGVNTAGPLTPIGPLSPTAGDASLTPMGTGQMPALGPFGGNTRVTPPPTGSYVAPNNYMGGASASYQGNLQGNYQGNVQGGFAPGGFAPGGQPTGQWNGISQAGSVNQFNGGGWNGGQVIGSGVQPVGGWSGGPVNQAGGGFAPNPNAGNPNFPPVQTPANSGVRSGGMQPIDLTGAPSPPGYQQQPMRSAPLYQPGLAPAPAPMNVNPAPTWRSPQVITVPSQGNIATRPSTDGNLQWRSPR